MGRESLSPDALVERMAKETRASGWDAVVSYRLDLFNATLQKGLDASKSENRAYNVDGVKTYEMQGHQKKLVFELDWKMWIEPPTRLSFTADGQVVLKMSITAKTLINIISGMSRYIHAYRKLNKGWVLTVKSPISSLSASQHGSGLPKEASNPLFAKNATVLDFNKYSETYQNKMAFNIELRDNWSLSIEWEGAEELEARRRVPKALLDSLKSRIRGDLGGIYFPLPLAGNDDSSSTPKDGGGDASLACVSAYIKTDATAFELIAGDLKPNFCETDKTGKINDLYPIPTGHSASIIINTRTLFWDPLDLSLWAMLGISFKKSISIWQPLKDVRNDSYTRAFTSVGDDLMPEHRGAGFQLKQTWNGEYPAEDAAKYMKDNDENFTDASGVASWNGTDYIYVADPALTVSANGTINWESNLTVPFTVRAARVVPHGIYAEEWKYTAKANKAGRFHVHGLALQATLNVSSSDWTKSWEAPDVNHSQTKYFVEKFLSRLTWPTWECNSKRNLMAITNFLCPGTKDVLVLSSDVRVPYDILLLGEVTKSD
ncbi:predicted protein [Uncinocarpus reesii 1704]|uniref:Uncharacterized protein n=1 Tax=Uncinocarpus reesii (strain UAMH 1704) TaxID=336963 RepID=C4JN73_UNCRE|nr:uncharacterized protein UREG_04281 [Uncinocarpus reesii 1704]EEP79435.1 predicted protein [Uncinocarpus reesii 1704]